VSGARLGAVVELAHLLNPRQVAERMAVSTSMVRKLSYRAHALADGAVVMISQEAPSNGFALLT
jgi:hypothetical protein